MSEITEKLNKFIEKVELICSKNDDENKSQRYTNILDFCLATASLIYDPEDARFFQNKMQDKWPKIKEMSHLKDQDAQEIIDIINEQLEKAKKPKAINDTYIIHVKNRLIKNIKSLT